MPKDKNNHSFAELLAPDSQDSQKEVDDTDFTQAMTELGVTQATPRTHHPKPKKNTKKQGINTTQAKYQAQRLDSPPPAVPGLAQATLTAEDALHYAQPGVQPRRLQQLRRGQYYAHDHTLDLHGLTLDQATAAIHAAISHAQHSHTRQLLIIHGKGSRSGQTHPRLKNLTDQLLGNHPAVIAFCSAQPRHGGTGAVYVLLKS